MDMNPIGHGTNTVRAMGPVDLSRKRYLTQLALRVIARGWRPPSGAILPDGEVFDSFGRIRNCEPHETAAADRVMGSCSFLLASHGDLRIEWEEKDHAEIIELIRAKMKVGVRFCILDPASLELVPIKRATRAMGREVYVSDPDIKKLIEGGFARFATTRFGGVGQIKTLGFAKSAEEAVRADTIAVRPSAPARPIAEADSLTTAAAIAEFLDRELGIRPTPNTKFTERTVYNWVRGQVAGRSAAR
jgi:hypothetical protein